MRKVLTTKQRVLVALGARVKSVEISHEELVWVIRKAQVEEIWDRAFRTAECEIARTLMHRPCREAQHLLPEVTAAIYKENSDD